MTLDFQTTLMLVSVVVATVLSVYTLTHTNVGEGKRAAWDIQAARFLYHSCRSARSLFGNRSALT